VEVNKGTPLCVTILTISPPIFTFHPPTCLTIIPQPLKSSFIRLTCTLCLDRFQNTHRNHEEPHRAQLCKCMDKCACLKNCNQLCKRVHTPVTNVHLHPHAHSHTCRVGNVKQMRVHVAGGGVTGGQMGEDKMAKGGDTPAAQECHRLLANCMDPVIKSTETCAMYACIPSGTILRASLFGDWPL